MDKDEILLKSKNDNNRGDELELQNKDKAEKSSYFIIDIIILMGVILCDMGIINGYISFGSKTISIDDFFSLTLILSIAGEYIFKYYYSRKRWHLIVCIFFSTGFLFGIYHVFIA